MNIFKVFGFLFLFVTFSLSAQEYKEYKVEKRESIKKIAKRFDISLKDLIEANPGISRKPKKNTIVKIPVKKVKMVRNNHPIDFRPTEVSETVESKKDSIIVHSVKPKETLYSLSKKYNVSLQEIIKNNRFLSVEGLKIGQELKIPSTYKKRVKATVYKKTHIVQPKETLYGISKLHNVSIDALKKANPYLNTEELKQGTTLDIPSVTIAPVKKETTLVENSNLYVIEKGETLYSISRKFGIGVQELLDANKSVVIDSLKVGSGLMLPQKVVESSKEDLSSPIFKQVPVRYRLQRGDSLSSVLNDLGVTKDSLKMLNPDLDYILENGGELFVGLEKEHLLFEDYEWFKDSIITDKPLNVLVMLPFNFSKNDTLTSQQLFATKGLPTIVSDFYMGVEKALDSLRSQRVKINLKVVDTEKSVNTIHGKIDELRLFQPDLIIGPLYSTNAMYVSANFPKVPVFYPIYSKNQSSFTSQNIVKTATRKDLFKKEIVNYIKESRKGQHLIIVGAKYQQKELLALKQELNKVDSLGTLIQEDVTLLNPSNGYISREDFQSKIKLEQENWILIADNSNVITADVFNNVKSIPRDTILETPVKIISFEKPNYVDKISYETLSNYQYTYGTDVVEYEQLLSKNFENSYFTKNHVYPNYHASRGFSVTYDAIIRVLTGSYNPDGMYGASYRSNQAFNYKYNPQELGIENHAVFVNSIQRHPEDGLKIIRLR